MKRKVLSLLLAALMVVTLLPAAALAAEDDFQIDGTVLKKYTGSETVVTIPEGITKIAVEAFKDETQMQTVHFPSTLVEIERRAFWGCTGLTALTFPEGFTTIGDSAFRKCTSLSSVTFPKSLNKIGTYCFTECDSLTSVTIPSGVTTWKEAFRDCQGLTAVVIDEGVTEIDNSAFQNCDALVNVSLPSTLKVINRGAFVNCDALEQIVVPNGVTKLCDECFGYCSKLKDVAVPGTVVEYDRYPFYQSGKATVHGVAGSLTQEHCATASVTRPPFIGDYDDFVAKRSGAAPAAEKPWSNASSWAEAELEKANNLGLIPDSLKNQDLTRPITRAEFAAVSVKTYEAMSGKTAAPVAVNPFTDCNDADVLKAYNVGVTNGTGDGTTFSPALLLNREQAATMLARVFKKVTMPGWTLAADGQYPLHYSKPAPFRDDADISGWAKDFVYFMAANGIIQGSNGNFMPKATTSAQEAEGYAQATREQALLIAVRMVENLG